MSRRAHSADGELARALFFGRLRDWAGCAERQISFDQPIDVAAFCNLAAGGDKVLEELLGAPSTRIAINGVLVVQLGVVAPGDEVAFMPPFSGG